jgi:hypothetical protein
MKFYLKFTVLMIFFFTFFFLRSEITYFLNVENKHDLRNSQSLNFIQNYSTIVESKFFFNSLYILTILIRENHNRTLLIIYLNPSVG